MKLSIQKLPNGSYYLPVSESLGKNLSKDKNQRVVVHFEDGQKVHVKLHNTKELGYIVYLGSSSMKRLRLKEGQIVEAEIMQDNSPYQFDMPEEFEEVLKTDPEADKIFHALTPGNQRSIIYVVAQAKGSETRVNRSLKIAERLKQGVTNAMKILKKEI